MHVIQDPARHELLEQWLANAIVHVVHSKLTSSGLAREMVENLSRDVAVEIADLWDGCHGLSTEKEFLSPFLVFASDNDEEEVIVSSYNQTGSFLHERVASIVRSGLGTQA